MHKTFHKLFLINISVLPALLILPAMADERLVVPSPGEEYDTAISLSGISSSENGAAVYVGADSVATFNNTATFTNNSFTAGGFGGAIYNGGTVITNNNATFDGNNATEGGAVYNTNLLTFNGETLFENNTADDFGGAIKNFGGNLTFNSAVTFNNNSVGGTGQGGALHNFSATTTFNNGVTFTNNTAATNGAAIYNALNHLYPGVVNIKGDSWFEGNSVTAPGGGGIVFNISNLDVDNLIAFANGNATFSNNTGTALWNQDKVTFTNMGNVVFNGNTNTSSTLSMAAISNGGNW
nr:hypothetical protein [Alphaproteobacteria bacterium]